MYKIMATDFNSHLSQFRVSKGSRTSHLGMDTTKGIYYIPDEQKGAFMEKYYNHVIVNGGRCDLIERHTTLCCLLYDLDFKLPKDSKERGYTQETINSFIKCVVRIVSKYLDAPCNAYDAFVCEKETPSVRKDCLKDGVHIMFPYIVTEAPFQHMVREEVLIESKHMFDGNAINSIDDIIDVAVLDKNGWMMYGSYKPDCKPYLLTGIWEYKNDDDIGMIQPTRVETSPYYQPSVELVNLLSIRRFTLADAVAIRPEKMDVVESWIADFHTDRADQDNVKTRTFNENQHGYTPDLNTVKDLVGALDSSRANSRNLWIETGWCLHNISESLLESWIEFSERDPAYADSARDVCTAEWSTMRNTGLGIGTLHMWVKRDNPKAYIEIMQNDLEFFIVKTVVSGNNHGDKNDKSKAKNFDQSDIVYHVATALMQKYWHLYVCAQFAPTKRTWYFFNGNRWVKDDGDIMLRSKIRQDLKGDYEQVSQKYKRLAERLNPGHPNRERYETIAADIQSVARRMRDSNFREKVMKEASELFYWYPERGDLFDQGDKFEEILDTQTHLVGMRNGVFDLQEGCFREARCEDYIQLSTDMKWVEYDWTDDIVDEIRQFLKQILPEKDVREYVMYVLASFLDGEITSEHFHIWVGSGGNGKSKLIELFENAFGKYCAKLSVAALTKSRPGASTPQPEIVRLVGKRFVVLQEPEENERIQVGQMKEYTGGDKITVRGLNSNPIEFKPQFKMVLTCNQLPKVPAHDGGTWRRIRVVKFCSKFVSKPNPECPDEYPMDPHLEKKLKQWAQPFFWMLTQYHKKYRAKGGYEEPAAVKLCTQQYQQDNDQYGEFVQEYIEAAESTQILCIDDLYSLFQYWHKNTISDKNPTRRDLQKYVEKKLGPIGTFRGQRGWRGYVIKDIAEKQGPSYEDDMYGGAMTPSVHVGF